ncbi:glutamate synthase large subunit [Brevundimonas variabilis]|uniref:Glutamate synthase (NADPH/NADH) large chain n=1 Tax=Brevundimonas variabilis TaxID=74312 RepID=A0A7W9CJM8_9CAUL|nr:glutamate synthase large subunit [Brevundimonas variabilis]MBB5746776.1 glutamate synthase (NADPH/NADH) large chain [Brevundimonas variabilis]
MTWLTKYNDDRQRLIDAHAYQPASEKDACGVGLVAAIDGKPRREVVELAIRSLKNVAHRGAVDPDGLSGDGAGIMVEAPQAFFAEQVRVIGQALRPGPIAIGQIFLPRTDLGAQDRARAIVETEVLRAGFFIYGWRQTPIDLRVVGSKADATRPEIEQIMLAAPADLAGSDDGEALERELYLVRRRIERAVIAESVPGFYICSLSARSLIYKGMVRAELLDQLYPDLLDPTFEAAYAIFHQRYSTNTFPEWRLAQPFRMLAHNGEINTLKGNLNWMRSHEIRMTAQAFGDHDEDVKPVVQPGGSDSASLDNVFEVLVRAGRPAPMAKALLIPEAWAKDEGLMKPEHRALYAYCNAVMEPWDGPAAICATDGRWIVCGKDRNGLRPLRAMETHDGLLLAGSEAGLAGLPDSRIKRRLPIGPGRMIVADLRNGILLDEAEAIDALAADHPYTEWLENMVDLEPLIGPGPEPRAATGEALTRRQIAAGFSREDLDMLLDPLIVDGKEAVGSMGDDTPPAVLSTLPRPLAHYFRQNFSQVTNPPIDPLREAGAMSLKTRFKNLGNILAEEEAQTNVFVLDSPILTTGMYERMLGVVGAGTTVTIDCSYPLPAEVDRPGAGLRAAIDRIQLEAETAVREGSGLVVLTDERASEDRITIPMIIATAAVHLRLTDRGLRSFVSIVVRSSEALEPHGVAVLVGVGATAVNPWLAQEMFQERLDRGAYPGLSLRDACLNYKAGLEAGLMKTLARKGISVISAYRGGCEFEVLGLSRALTAEFFPGAPSRISGIGLAGLEQQAMRRHAAAWIDAAPSPAIGGFFRIRAGQEAHAHDARTIHLLQDACNRGDYKRFKQYSEAIRDQPDLAPRDLLDWRERLTPVPVHEVESVSDIRKRFLTPGMSLGALSPEAHGVLNVAMNRIGARSVSGEGGEDPDRYATRPDGDNMNSAVKQIASGRFGVTAEYLNQCREIEIKIAQGAKPGEGGQLPGFKVTEFIARMRHSTVGTTLISPPPHHDIYSIEDLAQLIYDLKQINPDARVTVKLVSASGIGAIASGVAKAKADCILIAGHNGGTGASPQSSIKHAGLPWEIGLAETHQVLSLNNLRSHVVVRADGGMRTGRDIVIAAILGAEEFNIGTASLIAMGCLMVRQCHSNTCPVGVCSQDPRLREKFTGTADKVVNLFSFIAEEVREYLAMLGARSLDEIVGRTDLLRQVRRGGVHLDDLDLNPLLVRVEASEKKLWAEKGRAAVPETLDARVLNDAWAFLDRGQTSELTYPISNVMRTIGAAVSSAIVRRWGSTGPTGVLTLRLNGSAGQSFGAFGAKGLKLELTGEANDYVGKGLSGADIVVKPVEWREHQPAIGNTTLYGATSGRLFVAGSAGERFAVRNSGAHAVVEGLGAHGCEYMTGGCVVVLGPVGWNLAAGMSGGELFVLGTPDRVALALNGDLASIAAVTPEAADRLQALVEAHLKATGSPLASRLLSDWSDSVLRFVRVVPTPVARAEKAAEPIEAVPA